MYVQKVRRMNFFIKAKAKCKEVFRMSFLYYLEVQLIDIRFTNMLTSKI